jgi:two-component system sensor histidine kinase/response regulator
MAGARILLADDDAVNRLLAATQLELLGYQVAEARSGEEVLAALARESFDLVLMDCQMPGLDGYATTRRLRQGEQGTGRRTPVVAVTAHALPGERERCLASGMDDYLPKPYRLEELGAVVARHLTGPPPESEPDPGPIERLRRLGERTGEDVLGQVIASYRQDGPERVEAIRRALAEGDLDTLCQAAHALGGAAAVLGALPLAGICAELEDRAGQRDVDGCRERLGALDAAHRDLLGALTSLG